MSGQEGIMKMGHSPEVPQEIEIQEVFIRFPLALSLLDKSGRILFANDSFTSFCGASQEAVRGKKIGEVLPLPGLQTLLASCHGQQRTRRGEFPLTHTPGGGVSVVQVTLTPLTFSSSADPSSTFLLLLEDISEKVRWEEQLLQAEKLSGMAELAATLAHELGNPLGIISSTLQYVQTHLHDNRFHEELAVIIDQVERMDELLRTLMDVTGPAEPRFSRERVDHAFAQVLTFIAKEAEKRRVRIQTNFAPELPSCLADSRQLKQVFLNLCKNALEAMPKGGNLSVAIHPSTGTREVMIEVKDTGSGIPPEDLERIWKPFYSTKVRGSGLGLSLCRRVVEQYGGHIHVWSVYGQGTTFRIILPVGRRED
jgi:PAS domain S-box-containing protein